MFTLPPKIYADTSYLSLHWQIKGEVKWNHYTFNVDGLGVDVLKAGIRHPLFREPPIPMAKPYKWYGCSYYWGWLGGGFCSVDGGCIGYMYALCG